MISTPSISTHFDHLIGNAPIKQYLSQMVSKQTIAQSLLFTGLDGIGKSLFARAFATLLLSDYQPLEQLKRQIQLNQHPDVREYHPEGKTGMHSIDSMRQLSEEIQVQPHYGSWKIFIIHSAERMQTYSANALLKTFEEPPKHAIIILISSSPEHILPTILSRCQKIYFHALSETEIQHIMHTTWNQPEEASCRLAKLAQGSLGKALQLIKEPTQPIRKHMLKLLSQLRNLPYPQLLDAVKEIDALFESKKSQLETEVRAHVFHGNAKELSKLQQDDLEKEAEGIVSTRMTEEIHQLFDIILYWFRDIHLLHASGDPSLLMHPDYAEVSLQAMQNGQIISLQKIQKAITEAKTALERSTSLDICLEHLMLQLSTLRHQA